MPFTIVRNDITKMRVEAIVNAANTSLQRGAGVCGAIFKAAGAEELQAECDALGGCETGRAVITRGHNLPAQYIIHTPGPVWQGGKRGEEKLLRGCYINSLALAKEQGCDSIAFPLISSGIYGYPKQEALRVAVAAIQDFLRDNDMTVYLVVFDKTAVAISEQLLGAVEAYIDEHYVDEHTEKYRTLLNVDRSLLFEEAAKRLPTPLEDSPIAGLDALVGHLDEPFSQTLLRLIDAKGKTDVEVYKSANIDRKLFSKIRSNKAYMPSKKTAVALAIALELNLAETRDLLARAGYALSPSQKFDVIIEYFITNGKYDIFEINEVLFYYDQPLLGS
jgi:O-acetyl-ADP-ribose deacetylase (regulator of RNase III)